MHGLRRSEGDREAGLAARTRAAPGVPGIQAGTYGGLTVLTPFALTGERGVFALSVLRAWTSGFACSGSNMDDPAARLGT